jgi:cyclomaltodextrinase
MAAFHEPPDWVTGGDGTSGAIFYQIFPDRFMRSGRVDNGVRLDAWDAPPTVWGYKGGDLWGVIDRLDHLVDLGFNAIWFNPVFQSASNHRYHTHDYFTIDPLLGGNEAFDAMLDAAHQRGIRVVLDGVFNHASRGFFQFNDIAEHQEKSAYLDWFRVREFPIRPYDEDTPPTYDAWWGLHALPAFNTETEAVREFLWSVGTYWIERGIDGWRLDVPNEIATPGFWDEFRRRVRAANPEAYITGEIWGPGPEWVGDDGPFDGLMNYPLTTAIIRFAIGNRIDPAGIVENGEYEVTPGLHAGGFAERVDEMMSMYGSVTVPALLNLLDSHDTGRIMTLAGGDAALVVVALALLFTLPGAPCVYYGTEVGLEGGPDPDNRRGFPWDDLDAAPEILDALRSLIALRHSEPGLRSPTLERLGPQHGSDYGRSYVFSRGDGSARILVAVNHADEPDRVALKPGMICPASALLWSFAGGEGTTSTAETEEQPVIAVDSGEAIVLVMPSRSVGIWKDES